MTRRIPLLLALFTAFAGAVIWLQPPQAAFAAAGRWVEHEQVRVRVISSGKTAALDSGRETLALGLQFDLEPGWKVYWRSPGDAGLPPRVDWSGSENLAGVEMLWPVPHRFSLFGLETFGYGDEIVFPLMVTPQDSGRGLNLEAKVAYLVCEEICIPYEDTVTLKLPPGGYERARQALLVETYLGQVPGHGAETGLTVVEATLTGSVETPRLVVRARSDLAFEAPDLLVEGPPAFLFSRPEANISDGGREVLLATNATAGPQGGVLEGKALTITVIDGLRGVEQEVVARFAEIAPTEASAAERSLVVIFGLALLGGLILNLMPCVLPVLSIKLLSVVGHGGRDRRDIRLSFLATAAGVLSSFMVLAAAAIGVKSTGLAVGWGIQFQQPVFLTVMAVIVTLFACNLFGFFEIRLPRRLADTASKEHGKGPVGAFATGAFATLLATPCSAPFLGTAVGFALSRGPVEILTIFALLGLGLALPYLLIAAFPSLARQLPRPGVWTVYLRRVLGVALAATGLWLISVLSAQVGWIAAALTATSLAGLAVVLWWGHWRQESRSAEKGFRLATPVIAGLLAAATVLLPEVIGEAPSQPAEQRAESWALFDEAAISDAVAAGRVVFVDVTADWCITCQVNKTLVLNSELVAARLAAPGVLPMRGDWTLPSDEIADYLARFGRYGIPFNAVYGPGAPKGIALPEILTASAVTEALEKAARR